MCVGDERENGSGRKKEVKWEEERSEGQFSGVVKLCCWICSWQWWFSLTQTHTESVTTLWISLTGGRRLSGASGRYQQILHEERLCQLSFCSLQLFPIFPIVLFNTFCQWTGLQSICMDIWWYGRLSWYLQSPALWRLLVMSVLIKSHKAPYVSIWKFTVV